MSIREKTEFRLERSGTGGGAEGRGRKAGEAGECALCFPGSKSLAHALRTPLGLAGDSPCGIHPNANHHLVEDPGRC